MTIPQRIFNQCLADGMPEKLSALIVSQLASETAVNGVPFVSHVFVTCNNTGGYKWRGQSTAEGACLMSPEGDYYAGYKTIEQSVQEITQWIKRRQADGSFPSNLGAIQTPADYAYYLKQAGYYTDTLANYSRNLSSWYDVFKNYPLSTHTALVGILLALLAIGMYKNRKWLFNKNTETIFV